MGTPVMTERLKPTQSREVEPLPLTENKTRKKPKPFFNAYRLAFLGVMVLAIVAYLPSLRGLKVWDDDALLDGSGIGGGTSIVSALTKPFLGAYFRPLVSLSFYIENKLWTGTPFYYHQTNILLHMLACAALIGFVLLAFNKKSLALLSGLLFAIQPVQVSTVAWIGGRTDSLCSLLVILFGYTLLLGIRASGAKRVAWIGASVLAFFLAALTKEQVIAMILLVPLALKAFSSENRRPDLKSYARLTLPYAIASAVFAILWFSFNQTPFSALSRGFAGQIMTAGRTTVYYLLLFLAPSSKWMHSLSLGTLESAGLPLTFAGVVSLALLIWGAFILIKRSPKIGWYAAFVGLALLPVINLAPLPSLLVAPYRAGLAGVGVAVLLAWLLTRIPSRPLAYSLGALFVAWCTWLTFWGSEQWKDPITLFSRITTEDPYSIVARRNIGSYLMEVGRAKESKDQLEGILNSLYGSTAWHNPDVAYNQFLTDDTLRRKVQENQGNYVEANSWLGALFAQLGFAEARLKDFDSSERSFNTALKIDPKNADTRIGLSQYAIFEHRYSEAESHLRVAVAVHPSDPIIHSLLAQVYTQENKLPQAETEYRTSTEIEPWFGPAFQSLAEVQVKRGETTQAIETLKAALNCQVLDAQGIQRRIDELEKDTKNGHS